MRLPLILRTRLPIGPEGVGFAFSLKEGRPCLRARVNKQNTSRRA